MRLSPSARIRTRDTGDWLWGGLGVSIAASSASFAAYMIVTAPVATGSKDFSVFAQFDRRAPRGPEAAPPTAMLRAAAPEVARADRAAPGIDPEPTGSISAPVAPDGGAARATGPSRVLRDFVLHNVFDGSALVEHGRTLTLVRKGSVLVDAGEVLAIERRGTSWVVKTATGVINGS